MLAITGKHTPIAHLHSTGAKNMNNFHLHSTGVMNMNMNLN